MIDYFRRSLIFAAGALAARPLIAAAADMAPPVTDPSAPFVYPYKLPALGYAYTANEPAIDAMTMQLHHDKHHAAYIDNLNKALADHPDLQKLSLSELLQTIDSVPEAFRATVRNNAGGHANHTMFWQIMGGKGGEPQGDLKAAIDKAFGSFDKMKTEFNAAALKVFGSGWAIVVSDPIGALSLETRLNQDSPWMQAHLPVFGNDVWEHAYYLKYQNRRPDYVAAWWGVLNWNAIGERYQAARRGRLAV